ncbi:MAG TPA: CpaF family protein [Phycisphaerae bacterium]|nr:CpaF family protein [Phycisphaerae bacterium]
MSKGNLNIFEATVEHFLAPVMEYMHDDTVSEIMINSANDIYIERAGKLIKTNAGFEDEESLLAAVNNVLQYTGKRIDPERPLVDSRLPDGSRVHVVLSPLCRNGTCMSIRKFSRLNLNADHLLQYGSWTKEVMDYLRVCVLAEKNLLVAGGTSSGKTCLLNVISSFIPHDQRIVTIEDSAELELQQSHVVSLESRPPDRWGKGEITIRDLFRSSLRLRPDRIVIGEVRGGEALDMIQAMTSGHAGSMSTLHANTAFDALNRLETMALMSKVELPLHALRSQISSAMDVIVLMTRLKDGRRCITEISEVLPLEEDGHYRVQKMFSFDVKDESDVGRLAWAGQRSTFYDEPKIRINRPEWRDAAKFFSQQTGENT